MREIKYVDPTASDVKIQALQGLYQYFFFVKQYSIDNIQKIQNS